MALIRFAEGQNRSGGLGSSVYSHNRFGQYIRTRAIPVNTKTANQTRVRGIFASTVGLWSSTTPEQRAGWATYAANVPLPDRFGIAHTVTSFDWFVATNAARVDAGLDPILDAPVVFARADPPLGITIVADESAQTISVSFDNGEEWAQAADGGLYLQQGLTVSPTLNFFGGPWRRLGFIEGAGTPPTSPQIFDAVYPVSVGNQTFLQVRTILPDGRTSGQVQFHGVGTA